MVWAAGRKGKRAERGMRGRKKWTREKKRKKAKEKQERIEEITTLERGNKKRGRKFEQMSREIDICLMKSCIFKNQN